MPRFGHMMGVKIMANYTKRTLTPRAAKRDPFYGAREPIATQRPTQKPIKQAVRGVKTGGYTINETTGQRRRNTK